MCIPSACPVYADADGGGLTLWSLYSTAILTMAILTMAHALVVVQHGVLVPRRDEEGVGEACNHIQKKRLQPHVPEAAATCTRGYDRVH